MIRVSLAPERADVQVELAGHWLVVRFDRVHTALSWAIVGGGPRRTRAVAWHQVTDGELRPPVDPRAFLDHRMRDAGLAGAVGLLTSRDLGAYVDVRRSDAGVEARCIATVGLGNALRAGDPPAPAPAAGTINLLCRVSCGLTSEALLEALALAAEARALAVLGAEVPSTVSGQWASGTGTDCVVVAAPETLAPAPYAGKHTLVGHLIGAAVGEAITRGAEAWKRGRR